VKELKEWIQDHIIEVDEKYMSMKGKMLI